VIPQDLRCETLWLVGSLNAATMPDVTSRRENLADSKVRLLVLDGLNHDTELTAVSTVVPMVRDFLHTSGGRSG
jgi:hypothetical protein